MTLLEKKRKALAYCKDLLAQNKFDWTEIFDYACMFSNDRDEVNAIYGYLRRYFARW